MIKNAEAGGNEWYILDSVRNTANVVNGRLFPSSASAESISLDVLDIVSNGFKIRNTNAETNAANDYVFAAFAESPFKTARAR